jgi:RNA-directed DNA polymerase
VLKQEFVDMEVATTTGANLRSPLDWHALNWPKIYRNVRRLQARIVKAERAGQKRKVRALQFILTRSLSGKALAVRRVTENQGKRTPGVDGDIWNTPTKKTAAIASLRQKGYRAQPLRRVYIPKAGNRQKKRGLGIPTMKDRATQALYLLALDPIAETRSDPNSYGFRKERSTSDAIEQCFNCLSRKTSAQWILEGDIQACFDKISTSWLLTHTPMHKGILSQWLRAGYIERKVLYPTEAGVPQGGVASPVIANMALDGLEKLLAERFPRTATCNSQVYLVRWADDFIITGRSKELLEQEVKPLVEQFLQVRGLTLSPQKTKITSINEGFDFLGQNIRKYKGKLLIKPAQKNIKAFLTKVRLTIKASKQTTAGQLIQQLNPIIRGWANYHRHVVSKATFNRVNHLIFQALWRWAKRRHPTKSARWIKQKYFRSVEQRNWVFFGQFSDKENQTKEIRLFNLMSLPIKRHLKIKATANPYDPEWEIYFEQRLEIKMRDTFKGETRWLNLWQAQQGLCPICQQKITPETGWHTHHLIWRTNGGTDTLDNLVLLHPNCHRQVHSQDLTVIKPCPSLGIGKA